MTIRPRRGGYQVIVYAGIDPVTGRQRQIARQVKGGYTYRSAVATMGGTPMISLSAARRTFDALSYSNRSWHVLQVTGAKTDETRQRRITKSVEA